MDSYYFDTSALVKLYLREPGSDAAVRLAARWPDVRLIGSALARVEARSAFHVLGRTGALSAEAVAELVARLDDDLDSIFLLQPVGNMVLELSCSLVDRRALRAYDAVQLASCLVFAGAAHGPASPLFVSSDNQLLWAAAEEGLQTFNPEEEA